MVFHTERFHTDHLVIVNQTGRQLMQEITASIGNTGMNARNLLPGFLPVFGTLLFLGMATLQGRKALFILAEELVVASLFARRERHHVMQAQINACHLLVDTLGLLLRVVVHPANLQDRDGAKLVLVGMHECFSRMAHLWADQAYRGLVTTWITETLGWSVSIVQRPPHQHWQHFIFHEDPSDAHKGWFEPVRTPTPPVGFHVFPRRWVVERSFAWIGRNRRMSKEYDFLPATSEEWVYLSMIRVMLKRLAREEVVPDSIIAVLLEPRPGGFSYSHLHLTLSLLESSHKTAMTGEHTQRLASDGDGDRILWAGELDIHGGPHQ